MFCPTCGAEVREDTRFCPNCGTPIATRDEKGESDPASAVAQPPDHNRSRRAPTTLAIAIAVLALATAVSAGYLVYALAINPLPSASGQLAESDEADGADSTDETDESDEQDTDAKQNEPAEPDEPAETDEGATTEEPPAEDAAPAEPAVTHDFECDAFYVDVPDSWVRSDGTPVDGGPTLWKAVDNGDGSYSLSYSRVAFSNPSEGWSEYETGVADVYVGVTAPSYCSYYGTTSDGRDVYVGEVSAGFLTNEYNGPDTRAVLTLK